MSNTAKTPDKKYLYDIRMKLIFMCLSQDLSDADVARIFNTNRSSIHRSVKRHAKVYKNLNKSFLYDGIIKLIK